MLRRRPLLFVAAAIAVCLDGLWLLSMGHLSAAGLPDRLGDAEFWRLTTALSEPNGWFRSDNLVSNEAGYQSVISDLERAATPGGVYLGVGPEQNFSYIAALKPSMAFIVDVRRGNRDLQLMYKALFELAPDRADFVSRLFSRGRPDGLDADASPGELFAAYEIVGRDSERYAANLRAIRDHLVGTRHLPLSQEELDGIEHVYSSFVRYGPSLRYSSSGGGFGGSTQPTYADLMASTDDAGRPRSFLANEASYQLVKELETRNLVVPLVGNFGGPKALRGVAAYLKHRDARVSAFYVSNVEQYLRQDGLWGAFCGNVAALPLGDSSLLVRAVREGQYGRRFGGLSPELGSVRDLARYCR